MGAEHIAAVYTQSKGRHIAEALIYAALITFIISRALQRALCARWRADPWRMPMLG